MICWLAVTHWRLATNEDRRTVMRQPRKDRPGRLRRFLSTVGIVLLILIGVIATAALLLPEEEDLAFDYEGFD